MGTQGNGTLGKLSQQPPDEVKWQAIVECSREYDGFFFYGVKTTGIFCRPSCKAKTPAKANVVFFADAGSAMDAGYRPCKKCRPDKKTYEPDIELAGKVKELLEKSYSEDTVFTKTAKQLGVSKNHLARIFKQAEGVTPSHYIRGIRIEKALELLGQEGSDIIDIASHTGFKSLSAFYKAFKERTGHTPGEYRKNGGNAQ